MVAIFNDKVTTNESETSMKARKENTLPEVTELGGYIPTSIVCEMIGKAIAQHEGTEYKEPYAQSTINALPYRNNNVKAVKFAGLVLFDKASIETYIPTLLAKLDRVKSNKEKRETNQKRIQKTKELKKLVAQAIQEGREIDVKLI